MNESHCHDCGKALADGKGVPRWVVVRRFLGGILPFPYFDVWEKALLCADCDGKRGPAEAPPSLGTRLKGKAMWVAILLVVGLPLLPFIALGLLALLVWLLGGFKLPGR